MVRAQFDGYQWLFLWDSSVETKALDGRSFHAPEFGLWVPFCAVCLDDRLKFELALTDSYAVDPMVGSPAGHRGFVNDHLNGR